MSDETLDTTSASEEATVVAPEAVEEKVEEVVEETAEATTDDTEVQVSDKPESEKPEGYWPDDWRQKYAKDDEKLEKRLSRYASPEAALDAMIAAQNKISSGKMTQNLTKDATPEEIAEYRETLGIPEDPKDYSLDMSEGLVVGDDDKEMLSGFLERVHDANYTQEQVTSALEWYYEEQDRVQQEQYNRDLEVKANAEDELRLEWGVEYQANRNLMANYLSSDFGEGVGELITQARLPDGTMLANHPDILRGFVTKARVSNPMGALVPGSGGKQEESLMNEIAQLESRMGDDSWYGDKTAQERYLKLVAARDQIGAR